MIIKVPRVAISISCIKSNNEAKQLLTKIVAEGWECERILIFDSLGTGEFDKFISRFCLIDKILYFNSPQRKYLWLNLSPVNDGELDVGGGVVVLNSKANPLRHYRSFEYFYVITIS